MKTRFLILFLALVLALTLTYGAKKTADKPQFHSPQTEAERALDEIVTHIETSAGLMTEALSAAIAAKEKEYIDETCSGKSIEGEECGFSYNPIICAQDYPDEFLYRTVKSDENEATLTYTWPEYVKNGTAKDGPLYRMVKGKRGWMLDGIDCGLVGKFNMK